MIETYSQEIEEQMQEFYKRLPEKNKRLYAAIESLSLGYGGITYIAALLIVRAILFNLALKNFVQKKLFLKIVIEKRAEVEKQPLKKSPTSIKFF